jgi:hypothetical protein
VENIVSAIVAAALGRRSVISKLTFGRFGKKAISWSWRWTWITTVGLSLIANVRG